MHNTVPLALVIVLAFAVLGIHMSIISINGIRLSIKNHEDWRTTSILMLVMLVSIALSIIGMHDLLFAYGTGGCIMGIITAIISAASSIPTIKSVNKYYASNASTVNA